MTNFFGFNVNCNLQISEESLHTTLSIIEWPYQSFRTISHIQTTTQSFFELLIESRIPVEYLVKLKSGILYPYSTFSSVGTFQIPAEDLFKGYVNLSFPYNSFLLFPNIYFPHYFFKASSKLLVPKEYFFSCSVKNLQIPNNLLFRETVFIQLPYYFFASLSKLNIPSEHLFVGYISILLPHNFFSSYHKIFLPHYYNFFQSYFSIGFPYYAYKASSNLLVPKEHFFSLITSLQIFDCSLYSTLTSIHIPRYYIFTTTEKIQKEDRFLILAIANITKPYSSLTVSSNIVLYYIWYRR